MVFSQAELQEQVLYDQDTGKFWWLKSKLGRKLDSPAGWTRGRDGRRRIRIFGGIYYTSRLAWFYVHGEWHKYIDHINNDPTDDRISNLRPATNSQNNANRAAGSLNSLGIRGIGFDKSRNKFYVFLQKDGKRIQKRFSELEEALRFAEVTSNKLHGEFSIYR